MSMNWHPPVPHRVNDAGGMPWLVRRAWPGEDSGDYVLEVQAPDSPDVRAGTFRQGLFELIILNDPRLPSLAEEALKGRVVVHRAHRRAVVKTGKQYIKVFRPGQAAAFAGRHELAAEAIFGCFDTPIIHETRSDVIVFGALPGRSFFHLGQDHVEVTDASFARHWSRWSLSWVEAVSRSTDSAGHGSVKFLPPRPASKEAEVLQHWVSHWLRHSEGVPEAAAARAALKKRAQDAIGGLLGTPPDPRGWAHGDLHDKQLLGLDEAPRAGLLDFDEACQAEAALDLANLDAHLALRRCQGRLTDRRYAIAHHHVLATAKLLRVSPERFEAYAASTRLRLACLYSFRPPWGPRAADYLASPCMNGSPQRGPRHAYLGTEWSLT